MLNPLVSFKWDTLYERYDRKCGNYDAQAPYLYAFGDKERPGIDRELYYALVTRARDELSTENGLSTATYEAIMYWKLYSQPAAVSKICKRIHNEPPLRAAITQELPSLCHSLPADLPRALPDVQALYCDLQKHAKCLHGMKGSCSLAVRTTFLHFAYPKVIPLFDKQVLLAVGVRERNANQNPDCLFEYMQHAWNLSADPSLVPTNWQESPLRLLDMALWVIRGMGNEA